MFLNNFIRLHRTKAKIYFTFKLKIHFCHQDQEVYADWFKTKTAVINLYDKNVKTGIR